MNTYLSKLEHKIKDIDADAELILFGSRARGDNGLDSDYDLLVLSDTKNEDMIRDAVYRLELEYNQVFSLFIYTKNQWENKKNNSFFYSNVSEDGITI